jgi:hypothetical protein
MKAGRARCALLLTALLAPVALTLTLASTALAAQGADCVGRHLVSGKTQQLQIEKRSYQFYWGTIQTWRESESAYERRLQDSHRKAVATRMLIKPPARFGANKGMLMVTHEEGERPFDPNASLVVAYSHNAGVSFEFKKRTVNRLLKVAELRAKEVLESARGMPRETLARAASSSSFCVSDGLLTLLPLHGWYESAQIEGSFTDNGASFRFLFSVSSITDGQRKTDIAYRRGLLLEAVAGERVAAIEAAAVGGAAEAQGEPRIVRIQRKDGKSFPAYEWSALESAASGRNALAPYLYIWPADRQGRSREADYLVKAAKGEKRAVPLWFDIRLAGSAKARQQARVPAPQAEESMMPYVARVEHRQTAAPVQGALYRLRRNGKQVYEGRTDKDGLTLTQNVGYFDSLEVEVPPEYSASD